MWHYVYKNSNYNYASVINYASLKFNIKTPFEVQLHVLYLAFYLQKLELQYIAIDPPTKFLLFMLRNKDVKRWMWEHECEQWAWASE
jgi:hypothetical protein